MYSSSSDTTSLVQKGFPERPFMPKVLLVMFAFVIVQYCVLYDYIVIPFIGDVIDAPAGEFARTAISRLEFEVESDPTKTESGYLVLAICRLASGTPTKIWLATTEELLLGQQITCIGRFKANDTSEWGLSNRAKGIAGRISVIKILSATDCTGAKGKLIGIRRYVLDQINPNKSPARALLAGLLCGYRTSTKSFNLDDEFSKAGLSHLIAVSGSHLVIVASVLELALSTLQLRREARYAASVFITGLYVLFCACPLSALRSWVMFAVTGGSFLFNRRSEPLSALGLCGIAMCILDPYCASDLGFQLSVLSVCALGLFGSYTQSLLASLLPKWCTHAFKRLPYRLSTRLKSVLRTLNETLAATLVCQIATLFSCAVTFGTISTVAPLSNVVVVPLFTPLVSLGVICVCLSWIPYIGSFLMCLPVGLCYLVNGLVKLISSIPLAAVPVSFPPWVQAFPFVAGLVLYILWPRPNEPIFKVVGCCIVPAVIIWLLSVTLFVPAQIVMLDVGQGDALLIRDGLTSVLIDTGSSGALTEALARNYIWHLDAVLLTHLHDDHTGGLKDLTQAFSVDSVYVAGGASASLSEEQQNEIFELTHTGALELAWESTIKIGNFTAQVLWPRTHTDGSKNEDSLCFLLERGESFKMLFTGDAETSVLEQIDEAAGDIDVLKVGHHGSEVSISMSSVEILKPEIALISAGKDNSYGHPTETCVTTLEDGGAQVVCTIDHGDIRVLPKEDEIQVCYEHL